jgi:c-di-GMP-binding flagellar brake protein YcgR
MTETLLPPVGAAVLVLIGDEASFPSEVRDVTASGVVVDEPKVRMLRQAVLGPGLAVTLTWAGESAEYRLTAEVGRSHPEGCISLVPSGEHERIQRRRHVRAGLALEPTITDTKGNPWESVTLDVSESGMRCRVSKHVKLRRGDRVMASFEIGGESFVVAAEITWAAVGDEQHHEIGMQFIEPGDQADAIRRAVFTFQLRERQLRRT